MSKIGIQMYTLRETMKTKEGLEETLRRVAEIGYQNVQITLPGFVSSEEGAAMLAHYGLRADSAMAAFDGNIRERVPEAVKLARLLGTGVVRTTSIPHELGQSEAGYHEFARQMNEVAAEFAKEGLVFMYHFHAFEYVNFPTCTGMDILMKETDPACVTFQPDVFWLTAAGLEPSQALYGFKGRAKFMHLKDYAIAEPQKVIEGVPRISAPVGTGNLNWPGILKAAADIGIEHYVVEDDMGILEPFESARTSFENLRKMGVD